MINIQQTIEVIKALPDNSQAYWLERHGDIEEFDPIDGDTLKAICTSYERMKQALRHYQAVCDRCEHARILHLHDGQIGSCISVECYDPRCERFTNIAEQALAQEGDNG